jgi:hypothetical protein
MPQILAFVFGVFLGLLVLWAIGCLLKDILAPELEPRNLISLCEKHCCHLMIGHSGDWHAFNPHVEEDAKFLAKRMEKREYE